MKGYVLVILLVLYVALCVSIVFYGEHIGKTIKKLVKAFKAAMQKLLKHKKKGNSE